MRVPIRTGAIALTATAATSLVLAAPAAEAATTVPWTVVCYSHETQSEIILNGEWRKTSTTITAQHVVAVNTSGLDFHITRFRLTDETTGKYVNGPTGLVRPHHASKSWSPNWKALRKHKIVLALKGYMQQYFTDTVGCGKRP